MVSAILELSFRLRTRWTLYQGIWSRGGTRALPHGSSRVRYRYGGLLEPRDVPEPVPRSGLSRSEEAHPAGATAWSPPSDPDRPGTPACGSIGQGLVHDAGDHHPRDEGQRRDGGDCEGHAEGVRQEPRAD